MRWQFSIGRVVVLLWHQRRHRQRYRYAVSASSWIGVLSLIIDWAWTPGSTSELKSKLSCDCCNANRPKENMQCAERIACDIFSGRPFISHQKVKMIVENPE